MTAPLLAVCSAISGRISRTISIHALTVFCHWINDSEGTSGSAEVPGKKWSGKLCFPLLLFPASWLEGVALVHGGPPPSLRERYCRCISVRILTMYGGWGARPEGRLTENSVDDAHIALFKFFPLNPASKKSPEMAEKNMT